MTLVLLFNQATTSTPVVASDDGVLTDVSALAVVLAAVDSGAASEATSVATAASALESWTFSDASSKQETLLQTATDLWTLSELAALAVQLAVAGNDSWLASEAATLANALAALDSLTLSESTPALANALAAADSTSLLELASPAVDLLRADSWAFNEAPADASQLLSLSVSDALTMSELAGAVSTALAVSEGHAQTEGTTTLANALSALETGSVFESVSIAVAAAVAETYGWTDAASASQLQSVSVSDSWILASEIASQSINLLLNVNDSATQSESTPSVALSAADALALSETLSISATLLAAEGASLVEAALGGEFRDVATNDALVLAEAAGLTQQVLQAASDALTQVESLGSLAAALNAADSLALSETLQAAATILAAEGHTQGELVAVQAALAAADLGTTVDVSSLNTAAFVRILSALASAAATIKSMSAATVMNSTTDARAHVSASGVASASVDSDVEAEA